MPVVDPHAVWRVWHPVVNDVGCALLDEAVAGLARAGHTLDVPHRAALTVREEGAGRGGVGVGEDVESVVGGGNAVPTVGDELTRRKPRV